MDHNKEPSIAAKARAIAEQLRKLHGDHPPKSEVDVRAWHNKLYARVVDDEESMELFLAVCEVIERWHNERN
jgi:hypothetical protein